MYNEVVSTARAAEILGIGRSRVIQMIRDHTITTAYIAAPDGYNGRPGYHISLDEVYELAEKRTNKKTERNQKKAEPVYNRDEILNALEELQTCLGMLAETIGKLKEGL